MATPAHLLHPLKVTVINLQEDEHDYHFHVEVADPKVCEACGAIGELVRFGKKDQAYRDLPIHGKRVTLWLQRRRYRCNGCMSTFRPTLEEMDDRRMMTKRLASYIEKAVLFRSNTDIARECGLDEKTVRLVFADFCEARAADLDFVTPRVLGIDELYLQRQFRCVLANIEEQTVIDILPNRSLDLVKRTFAGLRDRQKIEVLSIDMYRNYLDAARESLPQAKAVIDKFHVVKMANEALEVVRKSIKKGLPDRDRRILKNDRKLMLMRERDLTPLNELVIAEWFDRIPALGDAYRTKERFFRVYDQPDLKSAMEAYDEWRRTLPAGQKAVWETIAGTVDRWSGPIFAYFTMEKRVTNAFTESANRKMKDLNRSTRGMSFEAFRAKVLFAAKHKVVRKKVVKSSPFGGGSMAGYMGRVMPTQQPEFEELVLDFGTPISTVIEMLGSD